MIDRRPAATGYRLSLRSGEVVHVWPDVGLVVLERLAGGVEIPMSIARTVGAGAIPLTDDSVTLLAAYWGRVLADWRARRRLSQPDRRPQP